MHSKLLCVHDKMSKLESATRLQMSVLDMSVCGGFSCITCCNTLYALPCDHIQRVRFDGDEAGAWASLVEISMHIQGAGISNYLPDFPTELL